MLINFSSDSWNMLVYSKIDLGYVVINSKLKKSDYNKK